MADEEIIPDELDSMDPHDLYESINKLAEEKGFLENISIIYGYSLLFGE